MVDVGLLPVGEQPLHKVLNSSFLAKQRTPLRVGQQVVFVLNRKLRVGQLEFVGPTHFSDGDWCGIELNEPCGKNDGSVKGVRYFDCKEKHGIFVQSHKVRELDKSTFRKLCDAPDNLRETTHFSLEDCAGKSDCKALRIDMSGVQVHSNAEFHLSNLGNSCGNETLNKGFEANIIGHSSPLEIKFPFMKTSLQKLGSERMEHTFLVNTIQRKSFNRSLSFPKISTGEVCSLSLCFSGDREKGTKRYNFGGQASIYQGHGSCPCFSDTKSDQICENKANNTNCSGKLNSHDLLSKQNSNIGADSDLHRNFSGRDEICKLITSHLSGQDRRLGEPRKLKETLSLNTFNSKLPNSALEGRKISDETHKLPDAFLQGKYSSCPSLLSSDGDLISESQTKCIDLGSHNDTGNLVAVKRCFEKNSGHKESAHPPSPNCGSETLVQSNTPALYLWQPPGKSLSLPKLNVESSENIYLESISAFHDSKISSWPDLFKVKKIPQITYRSTDDEDDDFSVFPSRAMAYSTEDDMYPSSPDGRSSPQTSGLLGTHLVADRWSIAGGEKVIGYASSRGHRSGPGNSFPEGKSLAAEPVNNTSGLSSQESLCSEGSEAFVNGPIIRRKSSQGNKTEANGNDMAAKQTYMYVSKIRSNDHVKTLVPKREIKSSLKFEQLAQSKKGLGRKKSEQNQQGSKIRSTKADPKDMKRHTLSAIPGPPVTDVVTQPGSTKRSSVGSTFNSPMMDKMVSHIPHLMKKTQTQSSAEKNKLQTSKALTTRTIKEENKSIVPKQSKTIQSDNSEEKPFLTHKTSSTTPRMTKPALRKSSAVHDPKKGTAKVSADKVGALTPKPLHAKKIVKSSSFVADKEKPKQKTSRGTAAQRPVISKRGSSTSVLEKDKTALKSSSAGSVGKVAVKSKTPVLPTSTMDTPRRAVGSLRTPRTVTGQTAVSAFAKGFMQGTEKKIKPSQDGKPGSMAKPLARTTAKRGTKSSVTGAKQSSKLRPPSKLPPDGGSASVASSDRDNLISGFDSDVDNASVNTDLSEDIQGLLLAHSISPEPEERDFNKEFPFLGSHTEIRTDVDLATADSQLSHRVVKPIPWPKSVTAPDILSEISTQKSSVGVQTEVEDDSKMLSDLQNRAKCMEELFKRKREECHKLEDELECRNWELIGIAILVKTFLSKLQHSARQVSYLERKLGSTEDELRQVTAKCLEEEEDNVKLQTEMMYVRSEHAVAIETLKADHDRMLEKMKFTLQMNHTEEMTLVAEAHMAKLQDMQKHQDKELAKLKEEHKKYVAQVTEKYSDELVEVESKHSHAVEEILEEHQVEIETIKSDYDDETVQLKKRCEALNSNCTSLNTKLRQMEDEVQRDIESRIESAITKYKSLPDELESLKVVLELKNEEIKQLRNENVETKMELENLRRMGNRVQKLEHENESLSFVVENKSKLERQISVERDSLRNTLEREVKKVNRLSLENEELQWRLFNSPSPQLPLDATDNTAANARMNRLSTSSLDFSLPSTINE